LKKTKTKYFFAKKLKLNFLSLSTFKKKKTKKSKSKGRGRKNIFKNVKTRVQRMVKVIFEEKVFDTKKEFDLYARKEIIGKIGLTNSVKKTGTHNFKTLNNLLKRHPEYNVKTSKMVDFEIVRNKLNAAAFEVNILNDDDTKTDISWVTAIKANITKSDLIEALRSSIESQIFDFKKATPQSNVFCQTCFSKDNIQIDHIVTFKDLVKSFLTKEKDEEVPTSFVNMTDGTNRKCFKKEDARFEQRWREFHFKHAELRFLCRTCNVRRNRKDN